MQQEWPADKPERRKVADLIPYANNARTHSEQQVSQIAASINEWGFTNPVLVDETGMIIAGHGRILAAQKLGIDEVPTIRADGWSEAQKKAYILADNQLALNAGWNEELIGIEIERLQELDFDIGLIGFDDNFIADLTGGTEGLTDPDEVPDTPERAVTVTGDLWTLGNHRLVCGDSTSADDVDRLMDGRKANICFTSPPYNAGSLNVTGQPGTAAKYKTFDDNQSESEFFEFLTANMDCMINVADEVFYNLGLVEGNKRTIIKLMDHFGAAFKDIIYWKKKTAAPHIQKGIINNLVEFIICFGNGHRKFLNPQFRQGTYWNVIEGNNSSGNEFASVHKATFPVYLPENIISNFTARNAIVLDCFGGTGTTMIACERTCRQCYMMDIDETYCDVIIKRWQDFTGQQATHENGKTFDEMAEERFDPDANGVASYKEWIDFKRQELSA
jgi:DNA modification methylase